MLLASNAVNASCIVLGMLFFHVDLKCLLVLVVPIALGAFQGLAGVSRDVPRVSAYHPGRSQDQVALCTLHACGPAIDMIRASPNGGTLQHVGIGHGHGAGQK